MVQQPKAWWWEGPQGNWIYTSVCIPVLVGAGNCANRAQAVQESSNESQERAPGEPQESSKSCSKK
eukprot:6501614-Karenia_brevis.AAC.1